MVNRVYFISYIVVGLSGRLGIIWRQRMNKLTIACTICMLVGSATFAFYLLPIAGIELVSWPGFFGTVIFGMASYFFPYMIGFDELLDDK